ncbi:10475_t:CDS:10 [Entrophospora sp. SA101]|nr:10475_t:CDS:10 [Entrophospora sp. SA101]
MKGKSSISITFAGKKLVSIEVSKNKAKKNSTTIKKPIKSKELSRSRQASIERMKGQRKIDQMLQELNSKLMKQRAMLGRVKEMIDSISFMFEVSGKNVMYLGELVTKLKESTSSPLEVMEHIELLAEVAPDWFKVTLARDSKKVVTIDGSYQLKSAEEEMQVVETNLDQDDDYSNGILLDANENPFGMMDGGNEELNRCPDPNQFMVKEYLLKFVIWQQLMRVFVYPISKALKQDKNIKIIFLCSPGNPTGTLLPKDDVKLILDPNLNGIAVVDETHINFVAKVLYWLELVQILDENYKKSSNEKAHWLYKELTDNHEIVMRY